MKEFYVFTSSVVNYVHDALLAFRIRIPNHIPIISLMTT